MAAAEEDWPTKTPSVPKPEILQGGTQRRRLFPSSLYPNPGALIPLPAPLPIQPAPPPPVPVALEGGLAYGTHSCRGDTPDPTQGPEYVPSGRQDPQTRMGSSHITIDPLPLVIFTIGELTVHFSENPKEPIGFFETILFTHQPTCDDVSNSCSFSSRQRREMEYSLRPGDWFWAPVESPLLTRLS